MGKLQYSQELVADVKRLYPDQPAIHKMAEEGNGFLGRYLDDARGVIAIDTVLLATSLREIQDMARLQTVLLATSLREIQDKARLQKEKNSLYARWGNEYNQWRKDNV